MNSDEVLKEHIRAAAVKSFPREFVEELRKTAQRVYQDCFSEVNADSSILEVHKLAKLKDIRYYRMEREISKLADKHRVTWTTEAVSENTHKFVYMVAGDYGLTQAYVQNAGGMPNPAKYRDNLASASAIPRLPIFEEWKEIDLPRKFYGLIAHSPVGKEFSEHSQKLGTIQLCVPYPEMKGWADEILLNELLALYESDSEQKVAVRAPTWKVPAKEGEKKNHG